MGRPLPLTSEADSAHTECGGIQVHLRIAWIVGRQHGPITREQLRWAGLTERQIDYRIATKQYFVRHPGVYVIGSPELSDLGKVSAAVLACCDGSAAGDRTAGFLRGLLPYYEGPPQVLVPRANAPEIRDLEARTTSFHPYEVGSRHRITCTTIPRTLFDLATLLDRRAYIRAFQRGLERGATIRQLDRVLERHKGERGTRRLRELVSLYRRDRGISKGGFEDAVWLWLQSILPRDFPRPQRNRRVVLSDGSWIEADLLSGRKIIELDFFDHHGGNRYKTTLDRQRDRAVRADGWELERFTSDEFQLDRARMERDIRRFLGC